MKSKRYECDSAQQTAKEKFQVLAGHDLYISEDEVKGVIIERDSIEMGRKVGLSHKKQLMKGMLEEGLRRTTDYFGGLI